MLVGYNERWRRLRKALHHTLQPDAARNFRPVQEKAAKSVITDILEDPDNFQQHIQTYAATASQSARLVDCLLLTARARSSSIWRMAAAIRRGTRTMTFRRSCKGQNDSGCYCVLGHSRSKRIHGCAVRRLPSSLLSLHTVTDRRSWLPVEDQQLGGRRISSVSGVV